MVRLALLCLIVLLVAALVRLSSRRWSTRGPAWLPKGWPDALRQVGLFVVADVCYETVRGFAHGSTAAAFQHARSIVDLERGTHLFFEQSLQAWVMGQRFLVDFANLMYVNSHFVITTAFLAWLYLRHNRHFYFVRNMFIVGMAMALVCYLAFPTAPPRFLPELGFVDTIAYYANVSHDSAFVSIFINPYAAVPSMHVAFSLMLAVPAMFLVRRRVFKVLWAFYPALITFVVIATGNHWWFDAAVGAFVAVAAAVVARTVLSRIRPLEWAWQPGAAEARV